MIADRKANHPGTPPGNLQGFGWRPIFFLNIPIGAITAIAAMRTLRETRGGGALDIVRVLLVATSVLLLSVPLIEGRPAGWPAWTFVSLAAAVANFIVFGLWEARALRLGGDLLIDIRLC